MHRLFDGVHDRLLLYVDGVLDRASTLPAAGWNLTSPYGLELGRLWGNNGYSFIGSLGEWAVYPTALSATQVATHYVQRTVVGTPVALQLVGSDPDGTPVTFSATGLPPGLTVNPATGLISGTVTIAGAGSYSVTATVSDGVVATSQIFTWTVTGLTQPPP